MVIHRLKNRSGFTMVEVMIVAFIMALTALIFAATFPTSQISRVKAVHMTYAVSLAQQKVEELRSAGYSSVLVGGPRTTPVPELPNGSQTITITQYAANIKKIQVVISWAGYRKVDGSTSLVTFISDHS